jgi:hypothetical protein
MYLAGNGISLSGYLSQSDEKRVIVDQAAYKRFYVCWIPYLVPPESEADAAFASPVGICLLCRPSPINNVSCIFHERRINDS